MPEYRCSATSSAAVSASESRRATARAGHPGQLHREPTRRPPWIWATPATGILVFNGSATIGGEGAGEGNVIAYNGAPGNTFYGGILASTSNPVRIRGNRIFANSVIGIDLDFDGVTPNDTFDFDTGTNGLQNFPLITSVVPGASSTHVEGLLRSSASTAYELDFFAATVCRPRPNDRSRLRPISARRTSRPTARDSRPFPGLSGRRGPRAAGHRDRDGSGRPHLRASQRDF